MISLKRILNEKVDMENMKQYIYGIMDDDNFPKHPSRSKLSKYIYNQFTLDANTNRYTHAGNRKEVWSKQDIEKLIKDVESDLDNWD